MSAQDTVNSTFLVAPRADGSTAPPSAKAGQVAVPGLGRADNAMSGLSQGLNAGMAMGHNYKVAQERADGGLIGCLTGQLHHANAGRSGQKFRDYKK